MTNKPKYVLEAEDRDHMVERRYQDFLTRGVMPSAKKPKFVPAEDIDSNAWLACPYCGGATLYGITKRVHVCQNCDWYYFAHNSVDA